MADSLTGSGSCRYGTKDENEITITVSPACMAYKVKVAGTSANGLLVQFSSVTGTDWALLDPGDVELFQHTTPSGNNQISSLKIKAFDNSAVATVRCHPVALG